MAQKLRKRYGQHLLIDKATIALIMQALNPGKDDNICEIGPGLGAITVPILQKVGNMQAIEIDRDLADKLQQLCKPAGNLHLHLSDVLNFDLSEIANINHPIRLVGNLPYNISTPLLFHLLKFAHLITDMHFMLQKEVVDRIAAPVGSSQYSRLSVMLQSYCKVETLFEIAPEMFSPPPKVFSSFLRLTPINKYRSKIQNAKIFEKVIESAFNQRRKTIRNSLSNLATVEQLQKSNIDPKQRAQELSIVQFIELANHLSIAIKS